MSCTTPIQRTRGRGNGGIPPRISQMLDAHLNPSLAGGRAQSARNPAASVDRRSAKGSRKARHVTGAWCFSWQQPSCRASSKFHTCTFGKLISIRIKHDILFVGMALKADRRSVPKIGRESWWKRGSSSLQKWLQRQSLQSNCCIIKMISAG